ncbi:MAG TPA: hypothetical protein VIJ94_17495, partial [Caulobacteraceae bacterium]
MSVQATICTVLTPAHLELAVLNRRLVERLNPTATVSWRATFNPEVREAGERSSPDGPSAGDLAEAAKRLPGVHLQLGPTLAETFEQVLSGLPANDDPAEQRRLLAKYLGSYHHAAGLALALKGARTRYAIILDPDFYVLRRNWVDDILAEMDARKLALFGAPWSPRWYQKYRNFPSTHLMVIDLEQCPWASGALQPDLVGGGRRFASELWARLASASPAQRPAARKAILAKPLRAIREDLRQRASIGSARDTGYNLLRAFRRHPDLKLSLLQPVFACDDGFMPDAVSAWQCHPLVEAVLPPRWRYLPHRGYFCREGFAALALPSVRELGWEEFLWKS